MIVTLDVNKALVQAENLCREIYAATSSKLSVLQSRKKKNTLAELVNMVLISEQMSSYRCINIAREGVPWKLIRGMQMSLEFKKLLLVAEFHSLKAKKHISDELALTEVYHEIAMTKGFSPKNFLKIVAEPIYLQSGRIPYKMTADKLAKRGGWPSKKTGLVFLDNDSQVESIFHASVVRQQSEACSLVGKDHIIILALFFAESGGMDIVTNDNGRIRRIQANVESTDGLDIFDKVLRRVRNTEGQKIESLNRQAGISSGEEKEDIKRFAKSLEKLMVRYDGTIRDIERFKNDVPAWLIVFALVSTRCLGTNEQIYETKCHAIIDFYREYIEKIFNFQSDPTAARQLSLSRDEYTTLTGASTAANSAMRNLDLFRDNCPVPFTSHTSDSSTSNSIKLSDCPIWDTSIFNEDLVEAYKKIKEALASELKRNSGSGVKPLKPPKAFDSLSVFMLIVGQYQQGEYLSKGLKKTLDSKRTCYHLGGDSMVVARPYSGAVFTMVTGEEDLNAFKGTKPIFDNFCDPIFTRQVAMLQMGGFMNKLPNEDLWKALLDKPSTILTLDRRLLPEVQNNLGDIVSTSEIIANATKSSNDERSAAIITRFTIDVLMRAGYQLSGATDDAKDCYYRAADNIIRSPNEPDKFLKFDAEIPLRGLQVALADQVVCGVFKVFLVSSPYNRYSRTSIQPSVVQHLGRSDMNEDGEQRGGHIDENSSVGIEFDDVIEAYKLKNENDEYHAGTVGGFFVGKTAPI